MAWENCNLLAVTLEILQNKLVRLEPHQFLNSAHAYEYTEYCTFE